MTAENKGGDIPDWARQERERDIKWIKENMLILSTAAHTAFKNGGRGAIVVDTTSVPVKGMGNPFGYYLQETVEATDDEDTKRMVAEYEPEREFVVVLMKSEGRTSTYRVQPKPPQTQERTPRGRPRR